MPLSDETAIRTQFEERARALYNKVLLIRPNDANALAGLRRL